VPGGGAAQADTQAVRGVASSAAAADSAATPAMADGVATRAVADSAKIPAMADSAAILEDGTAREDAASAPEKPRGPELPEARQPRRRPSRFDQPRWVMLRSLVVPGWGQVHNRAWIKAVAVAGGETWMVLRLREDSRALDRLRQQVDDAQAAGDDGLALLLVDRYNTDLSSIQSRQWLFGAVVAYALLDAYIDAHFRSFRIEFEADPALPGGPPAGGGMRVSLRWTH
jgi:hypothetical protein